MKRWWFKVSSYLKYLTRAKTKYVIHSPFIYEFVNQVLGNKESGKDLERLDKMRKKVFKRTTIVETTDFGARAGEKPYLTLFKPLGKIARQRSQKKKYLHLLYRLAKFYQPEEMLEFGTAVGISASYLGKACHFRKFVTMEGCAVLASHAQDAFDYLGISGIRIRTGNFDVMLDKVLEDFQKLDLVFFDGNHRKQATMDYFDKCLPKAHENTVFIFDDIRWSSGMEEAWNYVKSNEQVTVSVDLYQMGILFFRKGIARQDFVIRY